MAAYGRHQRMSASYSLAIYPRNRKIIISGGSYLNINDTLNITNKLPKESFLIRSIFMLQITKDCIEYRFALNLFTTDRLRRVKI